MPADGAAHPDAVQVVIERIDLIDAQVEQFLPIAERICKNQNPIHRQGLTYWRSVLNTLRNYLRKCEAIVLVKPQFEVGRQRVGKGGVVRDPAAHVDAIIAVIEAANPIGWKARGLVASPLTGPAGNHEYLLWLTSQEDRDFNHSVINSVVSDTLST